MARTTHRPPSAARRATLLPLLLASACSSVPYTGRSRVNWVPESQELALGIEAFQEVKGESRLIPSGPQYDMVKRVADKIAAAADRDAAERGEKLGFAWEVILIDSPTVNAWCLPGGKMGVYTGILPVTQSETGLAVVMGHEVAHAVARHGAERMTQAGLSQAALSAAAVGLGTAGASTKEAVMTALGVGANVGVMLPFSRTHESEADHIGLILMAKAGYDPREGPKLWERMQQMSGGGPPELLSTHPAPATRIADMNKIMPEMVAIYEKTTGTGAPVKATPAKESAPPSEGAAPSKSKKPAIPSGGGA